MSNSTAPKASTAKEPLHGERGGLFKDDAEEATTVLHTPHGAQNAEASSADAEGGEEVDGSDEATESDADGSGSSNDGESSDDFHFNTDEEAEATRQIGLKAYNESRFEDALDEQYRVVRYFSNKYGATSAKCGMYFLDYGLSQLRMLQSQTSVDDVLRPRDEEAMEACFINLDVARVCFQKLEVERGEDDVAVQLQLAEVHNAIAQLNIEKEDYDGALREYEAELLIYRCLQDAAPSPSEKLSVVPAGRVIGVLYGIADCFLKEADFSGATERLKATLAEVELYPEGTIDATLLEDLQERLIDAQEMQSGMYAEIQEAIQKQFAPEAVEQVPSPQEFYAVDKDKKHPFLSAIPGAANDDGREASYLSMPMSTSGHCLATNEHSNSQSVSLFPPQGSRSGTPGTSGLVQHVAVRKKPKKADDASASSSQQPEAKKVRIE